MYQENMQTVTVTVHNYVDVTYVCRCMPIPIRFLELHKYVYHVPV